MATQPPPESPQPTQPAQPDTPPPEIVPPGPDIDQPPPVWVRAIPVRPSRFRFERSR